MFELTKYTNGQQQILELHRLRIEYEKLYAICNIIFPKIKPEFIVDLLSREVEYNIDDKKASMYTVEIFAKKGIDPEQARMYIIQKTGMVPSVHDHGTHYVTN